VERLGDDQTKIGELAAKAFGARQKE